MTSATATLIATMVQNSSGFRPLLIVGGLVLGLGLLLYLTHVSWVQRIIDKTIQRTLKIANQSLRQSRPWDHGVIILAVKTVGE